jgi:hypothetical protein
LVHLWAGIDAGKAHHHCVVIDADGNRLLSQKIPNDEPALLDLIANVLKLGDGDEVIWATDLNHGGPALLIAILVAHGQRSSTSRAGSSTTPPGSTAAKAKRTPKTPP